MDNSTQVWQETFESSRRNMKACSVISAAWLWLAIAVSAIANPSDIINYFQNNLAIIGMLMSSAVSIAIVIYMIDAKMMAPKMNEKGQTAHKRSLETMRGFATWFAMISCICWYFMDSDTMISYFSGSILSAAFFYACLGFLGLSLLSYKMAQFVKTKHLG